MNGRQRTQRWLRGIAIRKMVLEGRTVLIARAGEPHMRVALVDGCVTWTKLHKVLTFDLTGARLALSAED